MKLKIKTSTLQSGLSKVNHVVNPKSSIENLNGVYFRLDEDALTLIGSDSDITIKCIVNQDLEVIKTGSIVLPKIFFDVIRKIDDEYVDITVEENSQVFLQSSKSEYKINGISSDNYPNIDFSMQGDNFTLNAASLKSIISETVFATSNEEIRPVLTGVNFSYNDSTLTCVATDSYRLARKDLKIEGLSDFNINVPSKCLMEVSKLLNDNQESIIYVNQQRILFDLGNIIVQSRLISGSFPDVSKLIPTGFATKITLNKKAFDNALDRASIMSSGSNMPATMEANANQIMISSKSQELGSIEEELDSISFEGDDVTLSFNIKFVTDALKALESENVIAHFNGTMSPFIITKEDENDSSVQLILPIKTY